MTGNLVSMVVMQPKYSFDGHYKKGVLRLLPFHLPTWIHIGLRFVPLPKSENPDRILSNTQLYDFELGPEEMAQLDGLDQGKEGAVSWNPVDAP
jgi:hypothetical protein